MSILVKAPNSYSKYKDLPKVFLAGSIEMGKATDWQQKVSDALKDFDILILNPRRDDWDSSWKQTIKNKQFRQQVEWELKAMEDADIIIMNFVGDTKSPITLMELGLHADNNKLLVSCDPEFWRRGNIEVVCNKYNIPLLDNIETMILSLRGLLLGKYKK